MNNLNVKLKESVTCRVTILPNYIGDVTSPGELCVLLDEAIPDPQGSDGKLKNPNGDVTQLVVGVFNSSTLLVALSVN